MTRARALGLALLAIGMLVFCVVSMRVGTNITNFMPVGSDSELAAISSQLTDSTFTRTVVVSVGAAETDVAIDAAQLLAAALRDHPEVAWVRSSLDEGQLRDLYELYFPRRYYFLSDRPDQELPSLLGEAALRERARELKRRLASPASTFFEPLAAADPIAGFERLVQRIRQDQPSLRIERGQFVTEDGRHAILLLGTRSSAFDSGIQGRFLRDLRSSFDTVAERFEGGLELELSGASLFAVDAERGIRRDIYVIAGASLLGVGLLFYAFVGSLRGFLIVTVPPAVGILVATTLGLAVFGGLDGITMVFGTSLMGIAIDYSNHLLIHNGLSGEAAEQTTRRIRPSLILGALTTAASFVGLAATAFPAFREMSFFAIVGILAALWASLFVVPHLLHLAPALPHRSATTAAYLGRLLERLTGSRGPLLLLTLGCAVLAGVGLPRLRWSDDMSKLTRFDSELVEEDRRVRERISQLEVSRFVIGVAPDAARAVALNDEIHRRLERAIEAGHVAAARSLHALLWSEELQQRNWETVAADRGLPARVDTVFADEGFRSGAFQPFAEAIAEGPPPPLTVADLQTSPLAAFVAPFVVPLDEQVAVITYLRDVRSPEAIRSELAGLEGAHLFDQKTFVTEIYREFRETTLRQMFIGGALVVLLLALRYRDPRAVVAAFVPSVLVALVVLALLGLLGIPANLMHVICLILVMGMGVDYGVFLVDSSAHPGSVGATMLSLLLSCLTTALVFGTLSISSQPSLQAIGITTGLGILLSYVLAPVTLVIAGFGRSNPS